MKKLALILTVLIPMSMILLRQNINAASTENIFFENNIYSCNFEKYNGGTGWIDNYNLQIVPNGSECNVTEKIDGKGLGFSGVFEVAAYLQYNKFQSDDKFKIKFDMYFDAVPVSGFIATNGLMTTGTRYMNNVIVENGIMKFYSGNEIKTSYELKEKTIYSFEYIIDNVSKKYSFLINEEMVADDFSLYRNDVVTFNTIRIGMNYSKESAGNFSIDNFSFTDYLLAEGEIFEFSEFDKNTAGLKVSDNVNKCFEKGNSYIELTEESYVETEKINLENTSIFGVSVKKKEEFSGTVSIISEKSGEIKLSGSDLFESSKWCDIIFLIDTEKRLLTTLKDEKLNLEQEIPEDFDFNNVRFVIKSDKSEISVDNLFLMTNDSAIDDVIMISDTLYVGGKSIISEEIFAGELNLKFAVYDKRTPKDAVMLVVHKQDEKIVAIDSVDFEYVGNIGTARWKDEIIYKRNDTLETYIWNSLSGIAPLTEKMKINQREEFKLYPDEVKYAYSEKSAQHPYIAINKSDVERVREIYESKDNTDEIKLLKEQIKGNLNEADKLVLADFYDENSEYFIGYKDTNEYVLYIANKIMGYNEILGFSYLITGDEKYAECVYRILHLAGSSEEDENVKYPHWDISHYLGTAQMTTAFAIGYDWAYDGLDDKERSEIEKSIYDYGVSEGLKGYRNNDSWAKHKNNWGMICNSGMILGATAIANKKEYADACFEVIGHGVTNIENVIDLFNGDGVWQESISYGKTSLDCLIRTIDTLRQGMGNDYGLLSATGLSNAAETYFYLDGPSGAYNFHDAAYSFSNINSYELMWTGREFNKPELICARKKVVNANSLKPTVWDLLWFSDLTAEEEMPEDKYFDVSQIVSLREANFDKNSLWIAAQAGKNNIDHCHLDCGSFVLDWGGYRWALDLGYDDYNLDGYFYTKRYNYYRVRAEGHNTLVINPSTDKDQKIGADTKVEKFVSKDDYSFAVMDLTSAYDAKKVKRGIYMGDNKKSVTIRDELELNSEDDVVYWYMHTDANVNIINNIAYFSKGQKEMQLEFVAKGCDAKIDAVDAKALIALDGTENDNPNKGIKKIRIKLENGEKPELTVKITPVGTGNKFESIKNIPCLDEWN